MHDSKLLCAACCGRPWHECMNNPCEKTQRARMEWSAEEPPRSNYWLDVAMFVLTGKERSTRDNK